MVSAIGSSGFPRPFGSGPAIAGLQAQLERYQKQLSDCVNCSTANTREGRENIQALSGKVSEIKARLAEATLAGKPATPGTGKPDIPDASRITSTSGTPDADVASPASVFFLTALGTRLDVFA